jgi:hypothetical protein
VCRRTFYGGENFLGTRTFFVKQTKLSGLPKDSLGQTSCFFGRAENILVSRTILGGAQNLLETLTTFTVHKVFWTSQQCF